MRLYKGTILLFLVFILSRCGGGGGDTFIVLSHPSDIRTTSQNLSFLGNTTRFLYVSNRLSGTISMVDQIREDYVDTDGGDALDNSPIIVGGELTAVEVEAQTGNERVYVADAEHRQLHAFDSQIPLDQSDSIIPHIPVDLGGATVGRASRPIFRNSGRISTPVLDTITVGNLLPDQQWEVMSHGEDNAGYRVRGSISGEQTATAFEDVPYTTDDGNLTFTIHSGGEPTTGEDTFFFGTNHVMPFDLSSSPVDLRIWSGFLYIVGKDPSEVIKFDLNTLLPVATLPLPGGSYPGRSTVAGGHLYIPDRAGGNIFDIDLTTFTDSTIITNVPAISLAVDSVDATLLHLIPFSEHFFATWDLVGGSFLTNIPTTDFPLSASSGDVNGTHLGLAGNVSGTVDVINLTTRTRIDIAESSSDPESIITNENFYDVGATSRPTLLSVVPLDGVAVTETWQLTYEALFPQTFGLSSTISTATVTAPLAQFQTWGVQAGDRVDITGGEIVLILSVDSETGLTLVSAPTTQGATTLSVRMQGGYLVVGSRSGAQANRVTENVSYSSDDNSISLTILQDLVESTTEGDFFSFVVVDGVNPITMIGKRTPVAMVTTTPPGNTNPYTYVVSEISNTLSILNLVDYSERKAIQ